MVATDIDDDAGKTAENLSVHHSFANGAAHVGYGDFLLEFTLWQGKAQSGGRIPGLNDAIEHAWLDMQATTLIAFVDFEVGVATIDEMALAPECGGGLGGGRRRIESFAARMTMMGGCQVPRGARGTTEGGHGRPTIRAGSCSLPQMAAARRALKLGGLKGWRGAYACLFVIDGSDDSPALQTYNHVSHVVHIASNRGKVQCQSLEGR